MIPREYLAQRGIEFTERSGELVANCPFCSDTERKFSINAETGAWKCFHQNRCGRSGSFWTLQRELGDEPQGMRETVRHPKKQYKRPKKVGKNSRKAEHGSTGRDRVVRLFTNTGIEGVGNCRADKNALGQILGRNPFEYYQKNQHTMTSPLGRQRPQTRTRI